MPNNKTFNTEIHFGGKVSPSLRQSTNTACQALQTIKNTAMASLGIGIAAFAARGLEAIKNFGSGLLDASSDMVETTSKINEVFKGSSNTLMEWSKTSTRTMGLARQTALDSAALYGDMATGMSISRDKAAEMAMTLTQLGADMASFKNISIDVAQTALKSVFTGETESLKGLGVVMTEAALQEFALSKGIKTKVNKMKEAEKVMLRYQFVLSKTKNSQGDYARTLGGAANQQRTYNENLKNIQEKMGMAILPYYTKTLQAANNFLMIHGDTIVSIFESGVAGVVAFGSAISNIVNFVQTNGIPIMTALGAATAAIATAATIDLVKYLGTSVLIASQEGLIATTNWGRYLMVVKGIPAAMKTWAASTWATVWANRALRYAIIGTGVGAAILLVTELALHWKEVWQAIKTATSWLGKFFNKGGANAGTPDAVKNVNKKANVSERNALGTPSFTGGATIVGEHGPELAVLPPATSIFSNNKTKDILNTPNAIGGMSFYITIQGNADKSVVKNAVQSTVPSIKQQIDAYFKERQRKGLSFA